jgi:hypothetical protein
MSRHLKFTIWHDNRATLEVTLHNHGPELSQAQSISWCEQQVRNLVIVQHSKLCS